MECWCFCSETRLNLAELQKTNNFTYTFRVFLSACKFWDEENDTWSAGGCQVRSAKRYVERRWMPGA